MPLVRAISWRAIRRTLRYGGMNSVSIPKLFYVEGIQGLSEFLGANTLSNASHCSHLIPEESMLIPNPLRWLLHDRYGLCKRRPRRLARRHHKDAKCHRNRQSHTRSRLRICAARHSHVRDLRPPIPLRSGHATSLRECALPLDGASTRCRHYRRGIRHWSKPKWDV